MGVSHMMKRASSLMRHVKHFSTDTSSVRVELVSEKIIKPSFPTPKSLRHYKLSYNDQTVRNIYMHMTLFYPNTSTFVLSSSSSLSSSLEKSLAKLLSSYYPYAGKLVHNSHVECNDTGVYFKEVRVKGLMSEIIAKDFSTAQKTLFPEKGLSWTEKSEEAHLAIAQLTNFDCGGLAISLSLSHKVSDGYTLCNFFKHWAELTRNSTFITNPPSLIGSHVLQPEDDHFDKPALLNKDHLSVVRLRFSMANIKRLKAIVSSESHVKDPTRFEVVAAMVNKCASDSYNSSSGLFDPFTIILPMNLRKLINPSVPNLFGNFLSLFFVNISGKCDLQLPNLVTKIRKEKMKHLEKYQGRNKDEVLARLKEEGSRIPKHYPNLRLTSSVCMYPLYDIDFGWGKPERVTKEAIRFDDCFVLLDTPEEGGVDAIGSLDQGVALKFKAHKDVLGFAEVDPSY